MAAHCDESDRSCDAEGLDAAKTGSTYAIVGPIAFAVGALAAAGGAYLMLRRGGAGSAHVAPAVGRGGGGLIVGGAF
jgi:hypothetical protein